MTSVFSSIPWRTRERPTIRRLSSAPRLTEPLAPDQPDLRQLNNALKALVDIFPDVQPEVFREMLIVFDGDSRLQLVTEAMLKNATKFIAGRYKTPVKEEDEEAQPIMRKKNKYNKAIVKDTRGAPLLAEDQFRSKGYRDAVKAQCYREFKNLNRSTVNAVLAEHNYSYIHGRPTLLSLNAQSWRSTLTKLFTRRKPDVSEEHPLVEWGPRTTSDGQMVPRLISTGNLELDRELFDCLVQPILNHQRLDQVRRDQELAERLNEEQAEEVDEMYDCECCYTPTTMQQMASCSEHGHYVCYRCIRHTINEALYGQGWARSIDLEYSAIRCIAASADNCTGLVAFPLVEVALLTSPDGGEALRKLNERLSTEALLRSKLPLVQCPFCAYAEIDSIALSTPPLPLVLKPQPLIIPIALFGLANLFSTLLRALILVIFFAVNLNYLLLPTPIPLLSPLTASLTRIARRRHGLRFTCLSPACGQSSCLHCAAPWPPNTLHTCHEAALTSLRTAVERAMADAVKRTCPSCHTAFVKDSGCNKMRCPCGYNMCYVCREQIGPEGYAHFCQHFRREPGAGCAECRKCDLYRTEDEERVVRRAGEKAEKEWRERNDVSEGVGRGQVARLQRRGVFIRREVWEGWLDRALDAVIA